VALHYRGFLKIFFVLLKTYLIIDDWALQNVLDYILMEIMFKWAIRGRWYCGRANGCNFNEHSV